MENLFKKKHIFYLLIKEYFNLFCNALSISPFTFFTQPIMKCPGVNHPENLELYTVHNQFHVNIYNSLWFHFGAMPHLKLCCWRITVNTVVFFHYQIEMNFCGNRHHNVDAFKLYCFKSSRSCFILKYIVSQLAISNGSAAPCWLGISTVQS